MTGSASRFSALLFFLLLALAQAGCGFSGPGDGSVEGRVMTASTVGMEDAHLNPAAGAAVALYPIPPSGRASLPGAVRASRAVTDENGVYLLEDVPGGEYLLAVDLGGDGRIDLYDRARAGGVATRMNSGDSVVEATRRAGATWLDAAVDGRVFCPGETIPVTVLGGVVAPDAGPAAVEFVDGATGAVVWTSADFEVPASGEFAENLEATVGAAWPASDGPDEADYRAYARLAADGAGTPRRGGGSRFNILSSCGGETPPAGAVRIVAQSGDAEGRYVWDPLLSLELFAPDADLVRLADTEAGLAEAVWRPSQANLFRDISDAPFGEVEVWVQFARDFEVAEPVSDTVVYLNREPD